MRCYAVLCGCMRFYAVESGSMWLKVDKSGFMRFYAVINCADYQCCVCYRNHNLKTANTCIMVEYLIGYSIHLT